MKCMNDKLIKYIQNRRNKRLQPSRAKANGFEVVKRGGVARPLKVKIEIMPKKTNPAKISKPKLTPKKNSPKKVPVKTTTNSPKKTPPSSPKKTPPSSPKTSPPGSLSEESFSVAGYEMLKKPVNVEKKPTPSVKSEKEDTTKSRITFSRDEPLSSKSSKTVIIGLVIASVLLLIVFVVLIWYFSMEDESIQDLAEICSEGGKYSKKCFHTPKYVNPQCKKDDFCDNNVIVESSIGSDWKIKFKRKEKMLQNIPERAPCGVGRWCIDGKCRPSDKTYSYDKNNAVNDRENFFISCNPDETCHDSSNLSETVKNKISYCMLNDCHPDNDSSADNSFRLAFRVCKKPHPSDSEKKCWESESKDPYPIIALNCTYCDKPRVPIFHCNNTSNGHFCYKWDGTVGICFVGICISVNNVKCE